MVYKYKFIILCFCNLFYASLVYANLEDTRQPISIEADYAVLDEKKQISIYEGNVVLKQGGIEVKANTVTVYTDNNQLQRVIAEGDPVQYRQKQKQEDIRAQSQRMEYEAEKKRVVLLGGAELWQGGNRFSGKRIEYDPEEEKVIASGDTDNLEQSSQRVKIILQPQSAKQKDRQAGKP